MKPIFIAIAEHGNLSFSVVFVDEAKWEALKQFYYSQFAVNNGGTSAKSDDFHERHGLDYDCSGNHRDSINAQIAFEGKIRESADYNVRCPVLAYERLINRNGTIVSAADLSSRPSVSRR